MAGWKEETITLTKNMTAYVHVSGSEFVNQKAERKELYYLHTKICQPLMRRAHNLSISIKQTITRIYSVQSRQTWLNIYNLYFRG